MKLLSDKMDLQMSGYLTFSLANILKIQLQKQILEHGVFPSQKGEWNGKKEQPFQLVFSQ